VSSFLFMCQLLLTPCVDHFSANVFEESQNIPSEIRACRSFEQLVSDAGKHCEKKDIALLYTPDMKRKLTDFDGLYLANTTPGPATGRNSASAQLEFQTRWAEQRREGKTGPAPSIGTLETNAVVPSRGGPVVVIEAKHDIDKSKIDLKLRQIAALVGVARDAASTASAALSRRSLSSTPPPTGRRNPPPPSGGGAKAATNAANLEWFAQHAPCTSRGVVVLFAAENWTPALDIVGQAVHFCGYYPVTTTTSG
jgi:hypothetical protein